MSPTALLPRRRAALAGLVVAASLIPLAARASEPDTTRAAPAAAAEATDPEAAARQLETDRKNAELEDAGRERLKSDPREQEIDRLLARVEKSPEDFELRYQLGNAYHETGHLHSALVQFNEAVRINASGTRAWVNRGVVLKELGRTKDAEASFRKALEIHPDDPLGQINLGDMLLLQKKYPEAVDAYRIAIRSDPDFPNAYYSLAIAFAESGLYRDAARAWRQCAELATARGSAGDKATAERALENAALMDEIIADAERELKERETKKKELESGASSVPAGAGAAVKKGS